MMKVYEWTHYILKFYVNIYVNNMRCVGLFLEVNVFKAIIL